MSPRDHNEIEIRERELAVIDAVVSGSGATVEDAELTGFALMVHGAREIPSAEFRDRLDTEIRARATADRRPEPGWFEQLRERLGGGGTLASGLAGALACVVIAVAAIPGSGGGIDSPSGVNSVEGAAQPGSVGDKFDREYIAPASALPESANAQKFADRVAADVSSGRAMSLVAPDSPNLDRAKSLRKVEQDVTLVLATGSGDVQRVADGVVSVTDRYRGYVQDSSVTSGDIGPGGAHFVLVVPSARLQDALRDLSKLANVRSRTQNTRDITSQVNRVNRRLATARRERDRLEAALAGATGSKADQLRRQLTAANRRVRQLRNAQGRDRGRIDYTNIDVTVAGDGTTKTGARGGLESAADTAADSLVAIAGAALVVGAISAPFLLLIAAVWFAFRRSRRRADRGAIEDRAGSSSDGP